jgi:hypothetical protein
MVAIACSVALDFMLYSDITKLLNGSQEFLNGGQVRSMMAA